MAHVDYTWRLLIGLGCVPACFALYFRLTIPETPRFTLDIERNVQRAAQDIDGALNGAHVAGDDQVVVQKAQVPKASWADFRSHFGKWENLKVLIGTSWSWFALDVSQRLLRVEPQLTGLPIPDCILRIGPQLLHHPTGHRLRKAAYIRNPQGVR